MNAYVIAAAVVTLALVLVFVLVLLGAVEGTGTVRIVPPWKRQPPEVKRSTEGGTEG